MRIDDFATTPDGAISTEDQTLFLLFGFDLELTDEPIPPDPGGSEETTYLFGNTPVYRKLIMKKQNRTIRVPLQKRIIIVPRRNRYAKVR